MNPITPDTMPLAPTTASSSARVPTTSAAKYLQQLCKHWEHSLKVAFTPDHGTIVFPKDARGADWTGDGLATLDAEDDALTVRVDATCPEQLDALQKVVQTHLDRFAFREAPLKFAWA